MSGTIVPIVGGTQTVCYMSVLGILADIRSAPASKLMGWYQPKALADVSIGKSCDGSLDKGTLPSLDPPLHRFLFSIVPSSRNSSYVLMQLRLVGAVKAVSIGTDARVSDHLLASLFPHHGYLKPRIRAEHYHQKAPGPCQRNGGEQGISV